MSSADSHAVFVSYASQDAVAARRICDALRAHGIEVWFDQSDLRGGDAWDHLIRQQIRDCALFIPVISSNTAHRPEGYFRLEWTLADQRTQMMARSRTFIVPVGIDATAEAHADVPDSFLRVQWTRLPGGATPAAFCARIASLLGLSHSEADGTRAVTAATPAPESPMPGRRSTAWLAGGAVATIAVLAALVAWHAGRGGHAPITATAPGTAEADKSVAVLPFADMSEKHDQEYFSDGLAEELLDLLSQVPDLRVPARTSSFYFKGRTDDVATIAQKLRVAHLLEGSVRRAGDKIRVTAQLIRADNGYHLWSKTYDRDAKDIFQVQDEIANAVVSALKAQLLSAQPLTSRHRTDNPQAFNEYLMGNQLRDRDTGESNGEALESYQRAAALDPNYAAAYSGIADAEWRIADQSTGEPAAYQRSLAAAEHAIALAPDSADGYWARGGLRYAYFYDWTGAEADFRKALELDPNDVRSLRDYSSLLAARGAIAAALELLRKAVVLDPLSGRTWRQLVQLLLDDGQIGEAKKAAQHLDSLTPNSGTASAMLGQVALAEGHFSDALAEFRKTAVPVWNLIGTAMAEHSLGHATASQAALEQLIAKFSKTLAYQIAEVYGWRGEKDKALEWLERAYHQHDGGLIYLRHDHYLASLRNEPRYRALLQKLNLPPVS